MLLHDWVAIEPEVNTGILTMTDGEVYVGKVKEAGKGYIADNGTFIPVQGIEIGNKIFFTQHLVQEIDGIKQYRVRYRDVIEIL